MNTTIKLGAATLLAVCATTISGCATTQPSTQLMNARQTYNHAQKSAAASLAPQYLDDARQALVTAERVHADEPGSDEEKHFAYLAERRARIALAHAELALAERRFEQAEANFIAAQGQMRARALSELRQTREQLADTRVALERMRLKMRAQGSQVAELRKTKAELEQERRAQEQRRLEADKRAQAERADAKALIDSLRDVATVKAEARETTISLTGAVLFRSGESELLPQSRNALTRVAEALKAQEDGKQIVIEGHADARGDAQSNEQLSLARAQSVKNFLIDQGVDAGKLQSIGRGEVEPIADNTTPEGRANNRRVEIVIRER